MRKLGYVNIIYLTLVLMWSVGLCLYVLKFVLGPEFYEHLRHGPVMFVDFLKFYSLGEIIWAHQAAHLYEPAAQLDYYNRLIQPGFVSRITFSEYPPHFMLVFAVLPLLPVNYSLLAWTFGSLAMSVVSLKRIAETRRISGVIVLTVSLAMVASLPGFRTTGFGQSSWLYLSVMCLWCLSVLKKQQSLEGIALALSTFKFQYTPFLLVPALAGKRKTALVVFVLSEVAFLLLSGLALGWTNVFGYPAALHRAENLTGINGFSQEMVNLRGLLSDVLSPATAFYVSILVVPVVMAVVYLSIRSKAQDNWICSLTVLTCLCFSPHTFIYDWVFLAIPAILLFDSASIQSISCFWTDAKSSDKERLCLEIWFYPLMSWVVFLLPLPLTLRMLIASLYGLLMFFHCLLMRRAFD